MQCLLAVLFLANVRAQAKLLIHEWGTFTSYQDEAGHTIGGINVDDEPVPEFVHRLEPNRQEPIIRSGNIMPASWRQGAPSCHEAATLRLETPVVYFYRSSPAQRPFSLQAEFRGGWITEFFPKAEVLAPGFPKNLSSATIGKARWQDLITLSKSAPPSKITASHVWVTPRNVASSSITLRDSGEVEKYVFYRGVGHIDSPLKIRRGKQSVAVYLQPGSGLTGNDFASAKAWLVDVRNDGSLFYRSVSLNSLTDSDSITVDFNDNKNAMNKKNLPALQNEIKRAIIEAGLFHDEAEAMLQTWRLSYFESPGLRLFFTVPRRWTDTVLPLQTSEKSEIKRIMLGRIELVSENQREILSKLYAVPEQELDRPPAYIEVLQEAQARLSGNKLEAWMKDYNIKLAEQTSGQITLSKFYQHFGKNMPDSLALYESLGRFRDALLVHEYRRQTDGSKKAKLKKIIRMYSACYSRFIR